MVFFGCALCRLGTAVVAALVGAGIAVTVARSPDPVQFIVMRHE